MPFLNFGGNKNKYCHLSDINLNVDPDPLFPKRIRGSGSTFSKGRSEDPDPLFPNKDPSIRIHVQMRWIRNAAFYFLLFSLNICCFGLERHILLFVRCGLFAGMGYIHGKSIFILMASIIVKGNKTGQ